MKKVIFDTDVGIDDAMALLFLHYAPTVDLLAIVTGFGNASVENTTRNSLHVKESFGIRAPVYMGAAGPITAGLAEVFPDFVHGANGLGDIEFENPAGSAEKTVGAQAIVDLARQYPQQIYIVAVGRLTNLALALELCPELPQLVREVVVMGGAFGYNGHSGNVTAHAEANIAGDPVAADRVFGSELPVTIVGLDVTEETIATPAFFDNLQQNAARAGHFIHRISRCYLDFHLKINGTYECPVHDSSAVAYLLRPDIFVTRQGRVRVATDGENQGQTIFYEAGSGGAANCRICTAVNADALLELYATTICSGGNQA